MTTITTQPAIISRADTAQTSRLARLTGSLLILEGWLIFAPMAILGPTINWPASLSEPANVMLPLLNAQLMPARIGYFVYLIFSVLFFPVALLATRVVSQSDTFNPLLKIAAGFAALSTLARCIGIIRWLVAMPALAAIYVDPSITPATREAISVAYTTLNGFGGSIGEVLGVDLFAALWLALLSITILRQTVLPRWVGGFGVVAAALLLGATIEMFGIDIGALIIATTSGIQLWFIAAGIVILRRGSKGE